MTVAAKRLALTLLAAAMLSLAVAACGGSSVSSLASADSSGKPVNGGTLLAAMVSSPDHLDPALAYTTESWGILAATNDGLVTFRRTSGVAGNQVVPDIATRMPTVTDDGRTYTFHLHTDVHFSSPVNRVVEPTDVKYSLERLFRMQSPGVTFYGEIVGAAKFQKHLKGGISGIVANNAKHTLVIHLTVKDGTFLDYMAMPFAEVVPAGTPDKDISTDPQWRIATGPYMIKGYTPNQSITIVRNPSFRQWTPNITPGHLNAIDVTIGTQPDEAVNQIADGQLDYYFEAVATDRLAAIEKQYPAQVHVFQRNSLDYFTLNMRKPPMNDFKVREALNFAVDRWAFVKLFGGQGAPTENLIPSGMGGYHRHTFYPHDMAKAKQLVDESGTKGMSVQVWSSDTAPQPQAAQYMASVLDSLGYHATVKTMSASIYYDTVANEATDPQVSINEWDEDFPEAEDFIGASFNGQNISRLGNNDNSNLNVPAFNQQMDAATQLPLGQKRNEMWQRLDAEIMKTQAPEVPFMDLTMPKFYSARLRGIVFNETFYELFPDMWLAR